MRLKSLLKRLFDKIVHDALPAALASILGGLLLTHFNIDRAPQPVTVKVTQASPEMMQLLRDEHGLMVDFVKEQVAGEKNRAATEQVDRNDTAEVSAAPPAQVLPTPPLPRPMPAIGSAAPKTFRLDSVADVISVAIYRELGPLVSAIVLTVRTSSMSSTLNVASPAAKAEKARARKQIVSRTVELRHPDYRKAA